MSLKNSNDTIGNRTHDLPVCCVVRLFLIGIFNIEHYYWKMLQGET